MSLSGRTFGETFRLTLLTDDPDLAVLADAAGVDRIGVDLEHLGKAQRQPLPGARISKHGVPDLDRVARQLSRARAFVRINPVNPDTAAEIDAVLAAGAQVIMLPYFHEAGQVETFVRLLSGRAEALILVETAAAVANIEDILSVGGIDEVMVGLNDLHLDLGMSSHFAVLASPLLEGVAAAVHKAGLPFSVGGVARPQQLNLPVPADIVLAQYPRLGASGAWLSRSFFTPPYQFADMAEGIGAIRRRLTHWHGALPSALDEACRAMLRVG